MRDSQSSPHAPASIFYSSVSALEKFLSKAEKPKAFHDPELATKFRAELFHLEGWARLHRGWDEGKDRKRFEKIRRETKELEDALGRVDLVLSLQAEARAKRSEILGQLFSDDLKVAYQSLKRVLKHGDWFSKKRSRTTKIRKRLDKIEWPSDESHYEYLASEIVSSIGKLQERFDKEIRPQLSKPLTHEILEHDVHESRRELRWFAIYFQTANGLFSLASLPKNLTARERKLHSSYKNSPFVRLPKGDFTKGWMSPIAYIELTRLIQITGEIKDKAEKFFFMKEGLMRSGVSKEKAHRQAVRWYGDITKTTVLEMQKVVAEYDREHPLRTISENIAESV